MEAKMQKILSKADSRIALKVYSGHFVTPHSHITCYVDMTTLKTRSSEAMAVAETLAGQYGANTIVDTIVCLDNTEIIGAYLAEQLTRAGVVSMNKHQTIYIFEPEFKNGQLIFRDNYKPMLEGKNVFILLGTATTGESLKDCVDSVLYYGGKITGMTAVFSAINKMAGMPIGSIFHIQDVPDYASYKPGDCPMCKEKKRIDGLVNGFGFAEL